MKVFLAILAAFIMFAMFCMKSNEERRSFSYCFIATMVVLGAMEIVPLFLA